MVETAEVLRDSVRHSDVLARLGGDEFAALMLEAGKDSIGTVIRRVQQKLDTCNAMLVRSYDLSLSIGMVPGDTTQLPDVEQLLSQADKLMYQDKQSKKVSREPSKSLR